MTAEQRLRAASALWRDDQVTNDQMHAALLIAKQLNFRPKTVAGLDNDRKAGYLASVPDLPEDIAARMLVLYHVAEQRPMMGAFLDAVGIPHENGLIEDDTVVPDPRRSPRPLPRSPKSTRRTTSRSISTRSCGRIRQRGGGWTACPKFNTSKRLIVRDWRLAICAAEASASVLLPTSRARLIGPEGYAVGSLRVCRRVTVGTACRQVLHLITR